MLLDPKYNTQPVVNTRPMADGFNAIERAFKESQCAGLPQRYGFFLRRLPDWFLEAMTNLVDGDKKAGQVMVTLTCRVGAMLHGKHGNPALTGTEAAQNAEIVRVGEIILADLARELLKRGGYLADFAPKPDPFGKKWPTKAAKVEASSKGIELRGEEREYFDKIVNGV